MENEAGGGADDADFYARFGVNMVSSIRKIAVAQWVSGVERPVCARYKSCDTASTPKGKAQLCNIRTVGIRGEGGAGSGGYVKLVIKMCGWMEGVMETYGLTGMSKSTW